MTVVDERHAWDTQYVWIVTNRLENHPCVKCLSMAFIDGDRDWLVGHYWWCDVRNVLEKYGMNFVPLSEVLERGENETTTARASHH